MKKGAVSQTLTVYLHFLSLAACIALNESLTLVFSVEFGESFLNIWPWKTFAMIGPIYFKIIGLIEKEKAQQNRKKFNIYTHPPPSSQP